MCTLLFVRRTDVQNIWHGILLYIQYLVKKSFLRRVDLCYHFLLKSNNHVQKLSTIEEIKRIGR